MDWSCYLGNFDWLPARTLFVTRHGSHAYGTSLPESDLDLRGIAVPPLQFLLGFDGTFEQVAQSQPDLTIFALRKFCSLAVDCNPNALEILFTDPRDHLVVTPLGERLLGLRDAFLSQKARQTFSGYAIAQLKRIRTHRAWLLEPPKAPPSRVDFGLSERTKFSDSEMGIMAMREEDLPAAITELYLREKRYQNAKRTWEQYENWKATRNPVRSELEAKHGYDTKHAMHLVRLLRMAREILTGKGVIVRRPDAEELLAIRRGAWTYEELIAFADREDEAVRTIESKLPQHPDRIALSAACCEITLAAG